MRVTRILWRAIEFLLLHFSKPAKQFLHVVEYTCTLYTKGLGPTNLGRKGLHTFTSSHSPAYAENRNEQSLPIDTINTGQQACNHRNGQHTIAKWHTATNTSDTTSSPLGVWLYQPHAQRRRRATTNAFVNPMHDGLARAQQAERRANR